MRTLFVLAGALLPAALLAQVDLTLQLGHGSGVIDTATNIACLQSPCPSFAEGGDSPLVGAVLDIPIRGKLALELRAARQETELRTSDTSALIASDDRDLAISQFQLGLRRHFDAGQWQPFGAAGVGAVRLRSEPNPIFVADDDRFSATMAGGARRSLSDRWGVRLEARANYFALPDRLGGEAFHLEASGGLSLRL